MIELLTFLEILVDTAWEKYENNWIIYYTNIFKLSQNSE